MEHQQGSNFSTMQCKHTVLVDSENTICIGHMTSLMGQNLHFSSGQWDCLTPPKESAMSLKASSLGTITMSFSKSHQLISPTQVHTTTYIDFSSELPENYLHLKNKIMNFKNNQYFYISNKDTPFFPKMMRIDQINTIKQLPNGVLALYKLYDKYFAPYNGNRLHEE